MNKKILKKNIGDDIMILIIVLIFLLIVFIVLNLTTLSVYNTTLINQFIIYNKCKKNIKSLVKGDWIITELTPTSIHKEFIYYKVYVRVLNTKTFEWTNDNVVVNKNGLIIKEVLTYDMMRRDEFVKKYKNKR